MGVGGVFKIILRDEASFSRFFQIVVVTSEAEGRASFR